MFRAAGKYILFAEERKIGLNHKLKTLTRNRDIICIIDNASYIYTLLEHWYTANLCTVFTYVYVHFADEGDNIFLHVLNILEMQF